MVTTQSNPPCVFAGGYGAEKKKDLERFYRTLSHEDQDAFWERMSKIDVEEQQNAATEE